MPRARPGRQSDRGRIRGQRLLRLSHRLRSSSDAHAAALRTRMDASFRRYSIFYFCYYAALGAYTPYISRWVSSLGHGGYVVGAMFGLWYGTRILAPPLWTALIHRSKSPGSWFVAGTALTLL